MSRDRRADRSGTRGAGPDGRRPAPATRPAACPRGRGARRVASLAAALALAGGLPAAALETDQFLAWEAELQDSTARINDYLDEQLVVVLERTARDPAATCPEVAVRFYRRLVPSLVYSRLRRFLNTDPQIDRHPAADVGYLGYLRRSVYRRPTWPFLLPMARTVRVGGIDVGVDKVAGHMFGFGRRYYLRYRRLRDRGVAEEEALRRVVRWGMATELTVVGGMVDGVFAPGDLEANYRGLLLARDLCEGEAPVLRRAGGRWRAERPIDLAAYVNPLFDEAFNLSLFAGYRWRLVREPLAEWCADRESPAVAEKMRRYRRALPPSLSQEVIVEELRRRGSPLLARSLDSVCDGAAAATAVAASSAPGAISAGRSAAPRER